MAESGDRRLTLVVSPLGRHIGGRRFAVADRSLMARLRTSGGPSHDLLVLLDQHRVMTTTQLARASSVPERTTRYRIERLHSAGLVDFARPGRERGSAPRHWWLRPSGARLVSGTAAADGRPSGMFVAHAAAITGVWLALVERGPTAGIEVAGWLTDRAGWQELDAGRPVVEPSVAADSGRGRHILVRRWQGGGVHRSRPRLDDADGAQTEGRPLPRANRAQRDRVQNSRGRP